MKIGEASAASGISQRMIRHYEKIGLMPAAARRDSGYRDYDDRDVHTLRSGQHWSDEIYAMIDKADIFQLFWSETAAQSQYVEKEWRYALTLNRDGQNFIRPVYWEAPMPNVPTDLGHIHFAYEPELDE